MATKPLPQTHPGKSNLQRAFENAVHDIHEAATGKISRYRSPIVARPVANSESSLNAEKRALSDAAKALAELWKIPQTSSR
jgi:hypothetical protein